LRERHDTRHVVAVEEFLAELLHWFFQAFAVSLRHEGWDHLVRALADLPPGIVHADLDAEMFKGTTPCLSVKSVAIYKGSVDVRK